MSDFLTPLSLSLIVSTLALCCYVAIEYGWPFLERLRAWRKLPPGPPSRFLMGSLSTMDPLATHTGTLAWRALYGPTFRVRAGPILGLMIADIRLNCRLLADERVRGDDKCVDLYASVNWLSFGRPCLLSRSTFCPIWRRIRKGTAGAYSPSRLRQDVFPASLGVVEDLCSHITSLGSTDVDMNDLLERAVMDIFGIFCYEKRLGAVEDRSDNHSPHELIELLKTAMEEVERRIWNPFERSLIAPWTSSGKDAKESRLRLRDVIDGLIVEADDEVDISTSDCLHAKLRKSDISQEQLEAETAFAMVAGHDTSAHTTAWVLLFVAYHKEVQQRLHEELRDAGVLHVGGHPPTHQVNYSMLSGLPYLQAVMKESMRLFPSTSTFLSKQATQTLSVRGLVYPAGMWMWMNVFASHRDPSVFRDPHRFHPERWLDPDEWTLDGQGEPQLMTFGLGLRQCAGRTLALMQVPLLVIGILSRFHIEPAPGLGSLEEELAAARTSGTLQPGNGLWLRCTPHA